MHRNVFVGGTFDTLHKGHIAVLMKAMGSGERITIGVTSDAYVKKFKKTPQKPFAERKKAVEDWLAQNGLRDRARVIPIDSPYEPAASGEYNALIITSDNRQRGEEINYLRDQKGLTPLMLIDMPLVSAEDGMPISSTRVKSGRIDEEGKLVMPEVLRQSLQSPLGRVLGKHEVSDRLHGLHEKIVITVGDVTAVKFLQLGVVPSLSIIDLIVNRQPYKPFDEYRFPETVRVDHVVSGPGHLTRAAIDAVKRWADAFTGPEQSVLIVDGEEDLMTLPAVVYAPMGSLVYYGQPNLPLFSDGMHPVHEGLVEVSVTQDTKERAMELLAKFG